MNENLSTRASARRVHLYGGIDFQCALLGGLGFSTKFIMKRTDLTRSQIGYRLRLAHIRRSDYRNGESSLSSSVLNANSQFIIPQLRAHLSKSGVLSHSAHAQWRLEAQAATTGLHLRDKFENVDCASKLKSVC